MSFDTLVVSRSGQDTHNMKRNFPQTPQTSLASATKTLGEI
jgi:hypothetical protein